MAVTKTKKVKGCNRKKEKAIWLKWKQITKHEMQRRKMWYAWQFSLQSERHDQEVEEFHTDEYLPRSDVSKSDTQASSIQFFEENVFDLCHQFAIIGNYEDSKNFLCRYSFLASKNTENYLIQWCVSLDVAKDLILMERIAHQVIIIQCIVSWRKQLQLQKLESINYFFAQINRCTKMFRENFRMTINELLVGIICAQQERILRLRPNGSDSIKILDMLPVGLMYAFMMQDVSMLAKALNELERQDGLRFMNYCIHAGLWVINHDTGNESELEPPFEDELPGHCNREKHPIPNVKSNRSIVGTTDPFEILDKLPVGLRCAFMMQDLSILQKALNELEPEDGLKYLRCCINAGLWIMNPDTGDKSFDDDLPRHSNRSNRSIQMVEANRNVVDVSKSPILMGYYYGEEGESE